MKSLQILEQKKNKIELTSKQVNNFCISLLIQILHMLLLLHDNHFLCDMNFLYGCLNFARIFIGGSFN